MQELAVTDPDHHTDELTYSDTVSLNTVGDDSTTEQNSTTSWNVQVTISNTVLLFKVDTGADVTAMSESAWQQLNSDKKFQLTSTTQQLCGPDRNPLDVLGTVPLTLTVKNHSCNQKVYVVCNLRNNLLSLPALKLLQMVPQLDTIQTSIPDEFPNLFTGLGTMKEMYTIKMKPNAKPHALYTPRNVPLPLRAKVQAELMRMESMGVISKVEVPTPWCAGMVVVPKQSGEVRICVDLKPLNENVLREVHPLPKVETTLSQLSGATVFSKIDTNSGFWQIPLDLESRLLTTFVTPFGRYCFNKLLFGISSAPEHFQRCMTNILVGIPGIVCHIDDVLIFGKTQKEHDERLRAVLQAIQKAGMTLNREKCKFNKSCISFLGHIIDSHGISQDPQKTKAITQMSPPTTLTQLRRFLGMINQMNRFSPNLAQLSQPLREILSTKKTWIWGPAQQEAFEKLKAEIATPTVLTHYDVLADTKISADASSHGLGAVLLQLHKGTWRPVAFASRSLSDTESRYASIEKEALALTWACERFSEFVLGKPIHLETDHKPLIPILGKKSLDSLPPRVLRFRLHLMKFQYTITHVPGKELYIPDTLSRAPLLSQLDSLELMSSEDIEFFVRTLTNTLPADKDRLQVYRQAQASDNICSKLICYCRSGWPLHRPKGELGKYWNFQGELSLSDDLLLYGTRIVVPKEMRHETLQKIHQGHQGIQRCRLRVKISVWWPGVSKDISNSSSPL